MFLHPFGIIHGEIFLMFKFMIREQIAHQRIAPSLTIKIIIISLQKVCRITYLLHTITIYIAFVLLTLLFFLAL